jgi:hypothetical protein
VHLLAGGVLFADVYALFGIEFEAAVRFAVFPALALTGIAMWQAARIRRALGAGRARRDRSSKEPIEKGVL